jgi:hypothetical protein
MSLANVFGVTNNSGVYGLAVAKENGIEVPFKYYGLIEQLASAYSESDGGADEVLTPAARESLVNRLTSQAERNLSGRWPTPLLVRVPDNSSLNPEVNIDINHLIPGVWVPLRATKTCRSVAQWQKLDSIAVEVGPTGEKVSVTLSPAPGGGDPDGDAAAEEAED